MIEKMQNQKAKVVEAATQINNSLAAVKAPIAKTSVIIPKEKKKGGNTFLAVMSSIIISILLLAGGLYLWQKYMIEPKNTDIQEQYSNLETKVNDLFININSEKDSIQDLLISIDDLKMEIEELKKVDEEPTEIEGYMTEEFEVPADWQTYTNEDWGIEFQYPADWEVNIGNNDNLYLELIGNKELREEWEITGEANNPYLSNVNYYYFEESKTKENVISGGLLPLSERKNQEEIVLDKYTIYPVFYSVGEVSLYSFFIENIEGFKSNYEIENNYEVQDIKTELNILKTLKFTK